MQALNRADFPSAIEMLNEVVVEDSENAEAWRQLGVCYLETAQPHLAIEALTHAVRYDAGHATAHYLLGNAYGSWGQLERAAACYRRSLEIEPGHAKAEEFLIRTESLLESREHYRTGLKLLYVANPTPQDLNRALRELVQSTAIFPGSPARDNLLACPRKLVAFRPNGLYRRTSLASSKSGRQHVSGASNACSSATGWAPGLPTMRP